MLKKSLKAFLRVAFTVFLTGTFSLLFCILSFFAYAAFSPDLKVSEFSEIARAQDRSTKLYYLTSSDSEDCTIAKELESETLYSEQNREWVKSENIPENLKNAFIAIEDHRFYSHKGIDIKRTAGALMSFVAGKGDFGGSTINQQLIKNITGEDSYSVSRKIKEIIRSVKLDAALSKDEILGLYLNTIYLSDNCYGIGAAAQNYFGKEVSELSLAECAALAAIPQSPAKWNPAKNPQNNAERRATVLYRMLSLGMISETDYSEALSDTLQLSDGQSRSDEKDQVYSWYTEAVIDECVDLLLENKIATGSQTAKKMLFTGGLSVITAQNPKMQSAVEEYFANESNFYPDGMLIHPECSMVVIDPHSGYILALAGATGLKKANRTLSYATSTRRSPGSSVKPLSVYAPAIDKGIITYGSVVDDTPVRFVSDGKGSVRGWPQNFPNGYRGLTTIRDAVARSVNTVAVKVLDEYGPENSFRLLSDTLGISGLVSSSDRNGGVFTDIAESPLALGQFTVGVTVRDITSAYTALAGNGYFSKGKTVIKILDSDGNVLVDNTPKLKKVFSEQSAFIMTKLLTEVTGSGTASSMTLKNSFQCAGKTGTTSSDCDRWFIGYTPDLLAGVWFGYPNPKSLDGFPLSPSPALKTFDNIMKIINTEECLGYLPKEKFDEPEGIVMAKYCKDSGKLVSSACLCDPRGCRTEIGYFTEDTVPTEYCDVHKMVLYDTVRGGIACDHCSPENCRYVGLLNITRYFPHEVTISDAQYVWQNLLPGTEVCLDSTLPFFQYNLKSGVYCGRSAVKFPFNRFCSGCYLEGITKQFEDSEFYDDGEKELC